MPPLCFRCLQLGFGAAIFPWLCPGSFSVKDLLPSPFIQIVQPLPLLLLPLLLLLLLPLLLLLLLLMHLSLLLLLLWLLPLFTTPLGQIGRAHV